MTSPTIDFSGVLTSIGDELTANGTTVASALGIAVGIGFVLRLIRRAAK